MIECSQFLTIWYRQKLNCPSRPFSHLVVIMWSTFLLWMGLVHFSIAQTDSFTWLNYLRSRAYSYRYRPNHGNYYASLHAQDDSEALDCPLECECPPAYPNAMYCHNRNLHHVPFVPSRMKYVYLQNNRITGITDGVFDNATELVWIILHMNQLRSDKISSKVSTAEQLENLAQSQTSP